MEYNLRGSWLTQIKGCTVLGMSQRQRLRALPLITLALLAACGGAASSGSQDTQTNTSTTVADAIDVPAMLDAASVSGYNCIHEDTNEQTVFSYGIDDEAPAGEIKAFRVISDDSEWDGALAQVVDNELYVRAPVPDDPTKDWYGDMLHATTRDPAGALDIPAKPSSCLPKGLKISNASYAEEGDAEVFDSVLFDAVFSDGTAAKGRLYPGGVDALVIERTDGAKIRVGVNVDFWGGIWGLTYPGELPRTPATPLSDVEARVQAFNSRFAEITSNG
jgi:hypothetical protein